MANIKRLSLTEFRRRVVAGSFPKFASLSKAVRSIRFVQADPIRSPARAQDLILRQRVDRYLAGDLERRFPRLQAEEGYLFAYGFMTPEVWQCLRHRPKLKLNRMELKVLQCVAEFGEVHPRVVNERFGSKSVNNAWGGSSQETKRVLEKLHHLGHLRVSRRENGVRMYQVAEDPGETPRDPRARYRRLAQTTAQVFGPTTKSFLISELRSHNHLLPKRVDRDAAVESLVEAGELSVTEVDGVAYLSSRNALTSGDVQNRVRILAPFDPVVRNRERFEQLWKWSYRFEAYVPAAKRERGYYAMPVLWQDNVIGWCNARVADKRLTVSLGFVGKRPRSKDFRHCCEDEVQGIAAFLGLDDGAWELTL